jgi:Trk K+ transport system NAD-binding subunit
LLKKISRILQAELRDIRVLFGEFKVSLFLFVAIILGGALLFFYFYKFPGTDINPTFGQALHAAFALIFFEIVLPFPDRWPMQILFFLIPVVGLAVVVDGVIRFGTALVNKNARGQKWQVAMASIFKKHVIICGMGRIGYRVALELKKFDRDVVAIESNPDCRFIEKAKALGIPVIISDARRRENLIKANVSQADAILPCTHNELTNLEISLDARELNPDIKVVMRMFDPELAERVEKGFGIHTAYSTSALAAPIFATAAMRVNVKHSFYVDDQLLNLSEVTINTNSQLIGWTVEQMENQLGLSFVSYHDNKIYELHPNPGREMEAGAKILVVASFESLCQINELNKP